MSFIINRLKRFFPNSFKHKIKCWLGLSAPPPPPPSQELYDAYEKAMPSTWGIVRQTEQPRPDAPPVLTRSTIANQATFDQPFFSFWYREIRNHWQAFLDDPRYFINEGLAPDEIVFHRRLWEFIFIVQTLYERGCIEKGKRGLGFAVGTEPLPALFAKWGCDILATDLNLDQADHLGWVEAGEHSHDDIERLNRFGICPPKEFLSRVSYQNVDMNAIDADLKNFDFCWSTCAFEHLGSIENGLAFVRNSLKTLRPGGVAVHTTDLNLSSDTETLDNNPYAVIYRRRDIRRLFDELTAEGHEVLPLDFSSGSGPADSFVDLPPYYRKKMHLKYFNSPYIVTSIGLVVRKATN